MKAHVHTASSLTVSPPSRSLGHPLTGHSLGWSEAPYWLREVAQWERWPSG